MSQEEGEVTQLSPNSLPLLMLQMQQLKRFSGTCFRSCLFVLIKNSCIFRSFQYKNKVLQIQEKRRRIVLTHLKSGIAKHHRRNEKKHITHAGLLVKVLLYWLSIHTDYIVTLLIPLCSQTFWEPKIVSQVRRMDVKKMLIPGKQPLYLLTLN